MMGNLLNANLLKQLKSRILCHIESPVLFMHHRPTLLTTKSIDFFIFFVVLSPLFLQTPYTAVLYVH